MAQASGWPGRHGPGGGLYTAGTTMSLALTTVASNIDPGRDRWGRASQRWPGWGAGGHGFGGGVSSEDRILEVTGSTFKSNQAIGGNGGPAAPLVWARVVGCTSPLSLPCSPNRLSSATALGWLRGAGLRPASVGATEMRAGMGGWPRRRCVSGGYLCLPLHRTATPL